MHVGSRSSEATLCRLLSTSHPLRANHSEVKRDPRHVAPVFWISTTVHSTGRADTAILFEMDMPDDDSMNMTTENATSHSG